MLFSPTSNHFRVDIDTVIGLSGPFVAKDSPTAEM
jgi:hypothetical protein